MIIKPSEHIHWYDNQRNEILQELWSLIGTNVESIFALVFASITNKKQNNSTNKTNKSMDIHSFIGSIIQFTVRV